MATSTVVGCSCQWNLERPKIWLCPGCHTYRKGKTVFTSVSQVIKALIPADYSQVDPVVLEIARLRGTFVDTYFSEWLVDPASTLQLASVKAI